MIELVALRLFTRSDVNGICGEARLIDKELGTFDTEFGPMYNYDKGLTTSADGEREILQALGDAITETLCK